MFLIVHVYVVHMHVYLVPKHDVVFKFLLCSSLAWHT